MGCLWSCLVTCRKCSSKQISYTVQRLPREHQHYSTADTRRARQIIFSTSQALSSKKTSGGVEAREEAAQVKAWRLRSEEGGGLLVEAIHLPCDFNELKPQVPHSSWDWQRIYEKVTHENIFACLVAKATISLVFMLINIRALRPRTVSLGLCSQVHFQVYKNMSNVMSLMRRGGTTTVTSHWCKGCF